MSQKRELQYGKYPLKKFNPDRVAKILASIGRGTPYKIAAEANGVGERTFYDWMYKGIDDLNDEIESDYATMVQSLREIEQSRITRNQESIETSPDGHDGAKWILERVFWKYFSAKAAEVEFEERLSAVERKQGESNESESKLPGDSKSDSAEGTPTSQDSEASLEQGKSG